MRRIDSELLVISAAILWGTTGTAQAFVPPGADPRSVGAIRLAIGGLALLTISLARGYSFRRIRWPLIPTLIAGISMAAYNLFFFAGVAKAGVAIGTIVTIGSAPILAGLLGWLFRKERPGRRWCLATILAVCGGILLILPGEKLSVDSLGISLALLSGLSYAVFSVASKGMLEKAPPDAAMAVVFTLGAVFLSPILLTTDLTWLSQPSGWMPALFLGLAATALAYTLFARGLVSVPVAKAVTLTLAEPLTAGMLGIFLLGELLTGASALGILLLFVGLVIVSVEKSQST
ncbi:MAG: EamA family transporter [Anaerolineales bacterium]|nr:EamA family transporter [Chloroflexota bacterium]MBL7161630.1 EamA family transporter [Anaerolineales bacterium]